MDEKRKTILLTEQGYEDAEEILNVKDLKGRVSIRRRGTKAQKTSSLLEWVQDRAKQVKANDGSILRDQLELCLGYVAK